MQKILSVFAFMSLCSFYLSAFDCGDIWGVQTAQFKKTDYTTGYLNFRFEDSGVGDGSWSEGSDLICLYTYDTPGWPPFINGWPPTEYPSSYLSQIITIRLDPNSQIRLLYSSGNIGDVTLSTTRNKQIWDLVHEDYLYADEYNTTYDSRYWYGNKFYYRLDDALINAVYRVQVKIGFFWYNTSYKIEILQNDSYNWY